ncbi:MAG: EamA family transporter [Nitriliruptorales bacterium]|nr:EamA family transporter [Nitriliruptorales bacterium]
MSDDSTPARHLPYATGVAGALLIAFSAILVRLAGVSPSTAAIYRCAYAVPVLAVLAWRESRRFGPRPWTLRRPALIAGVFFAGDLVAWHYAIDAVGAGLATVLGNTQVAMVGVAAWVFLGERPRRSTVVAVPVVLFGVVLISGVIGDGAYGRAPVAGAVFGLLTAAFYAAFILILRHGNSDLRRPAGPLLDATAVGAVVSLLAALALGDADVAPQWPAHGWLVVLALTSQVVAWLLISVSLPRLPAATTSIVLTLQPVGSVFLGMVLLGEAPSPVQLAGVAVVLAGIVMATLGRGPRLRPRPTLDPAPSG